MPRLPRNLLPAEGIYHVTARGVARVAISRDDADRRLYLLLLARAVLREDWDCHVFCLMPNTPQPQRAPLREPLRRIRDQERGPPPASLRVRPSEPCSRGPLPRGGRMVLERCPVGRDYPPASCRRRMI
jgi:hypothetical protein